jgi:hydrogenase maturation protein HypF
VRIQIRGAVQGVGFRPFVYRLAHELDLTGFVGNDGRGVTIEVQGERWELFLERLTEDGPPLAEIHDLESVELEDQAEAGFEIRGSATTDTPTAVVLADSTPCAACLAEMRDPNDRRYRYPFLNCTDCGPRFSIVQSLPYDRANTTMRSFAMCDACRSEYENPLDRRFHAQPTACPKCGPRLSGELTVRPGEIVALKGLGGYQLLCDARDDRAVSRLRERKHREEKPFAIMVRDIKMAREVVEVSLESEQLLRSRAAPIVLLVRKGEVGLPIAPSVAPGNPRLGVMLPSTPLHHLLFESIDFPIVATSGNLSDEPICIDRAQDYLGGIADRIIDHDRPIARPVDDSVATIADGAPYLLRRARGYAPRPVRLARSVPPVLALGGHLKNSVALAVADQVFVSQHIGDLDTAKARDAFESVIADFLAMYGVAPAIVARDLHPNYASSIWWLENRFEAKEVAVQHHHAHLASCLAENHHEGPALGVIWDGTGLGPDGTIWGGEFLLGDARGYERVAHFKPFRLPGGDAAAREPRRSALALGYEVPGAFEKQEAALLRQMIERGTNAPETTSAGRLFDGVAAILGLRSHSAFEGQAAMMLEWIADPCEEGRSVMPIENGVIDWAPAIAELDADPAIASARFHNTLIDVIVQVARETDCGTVALSGGCFQNLRLLEGALAALRKENFKVLIHREVPANDGGIALGQVAVAAASE